jgi:hypothetical protein
VVQALAEYETKRRETTAKIVRTNREHPPDFINIKVEELVGDRPFDDLDKYITQDELRALSENYKRVAGFSLPDVAARSAGGLRRPAPPPGRPTPGAVGPPALRANGLDPFGHQENAGVLGVIFIEKSAIFRQSSARLDASFNMAGIPARLGGNHGTYVDAA